MFLGSVVAAQSRQRLGSQSDFSTSNLGVGPNFLPASISIGNLNAVGEFYTQAAFANESLFLPLDFNRSDVVTSILEFNIVNTLVSGLEDPINITFTASVSSDPEHSGVYTCMFRTSKHCVRGTCIIPFASQSSHWRACKTLPTSAASLGIQHWMVTRALNRNACMQQNGRV